MPTAREKQAIRRRFNALLDRIQQEYPHLIISYILYLLDRKPTGTDSQNGHREDSTNG